MLSWGREVARAESADRSPVTTQNWCRAEGSLALAYRTTPFWLRSLRSVCAHCPRYYYAGAHAARTPLSRPYRGRNEVRAERSNISLCGSDSVPPPIGRAVAPRGFCRPSGAPFPPTCGPGKRRSECVWHSVGRLQRPHRAQCGAPFPTTYGAGKRRSECVPCGVPIPTKRRA